MCDFGDEETVTIFIQQMNQSDTDSLSITRLMTMNGRKQKKGERRDRWSERDTDTAGESVTMLHFWQGLYRREWYMMYTI